MVMRMGKRDWMGDLKIGKSGRPPAGRTVVYQCAKWHVAGKDSWLASQVCFVSDVKLFSVHGWGCAGRSGDTRQNMGQ